jgi:hypothetical protein
MINIQDQVASMNTIDHEHNAQSYLDEPNHEGLQIICEERQNNPSSYLVKIIFSMRIDLT